MQLNSVPVKRPSEEHRTVRSIQSTHNRTALNRMLPSFGVINFTCVLVVMTSQKVYPETVCPNPHAVFVSVSSNMYSTNPSASQTHPGASVFPELSTLNVYSVLGGCKTRKTFALAFLRS